MGNIKATTINLPLHTAIDYAMTHIEGHFAGKKMATPYICSKPGAGKSEMLAWQCARDNIGFVPITVGLIRVERFTGIPDFVKRKYQEKEELWTEWSVPEIVCMLREAAEKYDKVVCLYDDWHIAPPEVQASGFETFSYHSINGYSIPKDRVAFMLAGNTSAAAGARNSFSAVMNRVCKIHCEADFDFWRDQYAYKTDVNPEFISFLDNQSYQHHFHGEEDTKEPWPSPRSWTECARAIDQMKLGGWDLQGEQNNVMHSIVAAHVGNKAASEFMIYHNIYSLINAKRIFDTGKWKLPQEPIKRFAFGAATAAEFYDRHVKKEKGALKLFCEMMNSFEKNCPEIAIRSIRFLAGKDFTIPQALVKNKALSQKTLSRLLEISKTLQ